MVAEDQDKQEKTTANQSGLEKGEIIPEPPPIFRNIKWIFLYGWKHKGLVTIAALLVGVGWLVSSENWVIPVIGARTAANKLLDAEILRLVKDIRANFRRARDNLIERGNSDLSEVESDLKALFRLDRQNGHYLYFSGEVKRLKDSERFTPKSCVKIPISGNLTTFDAYRNDFYMYLEVAATLPASEKGGDTGSETCYQRPRGYCPQRTGWIHHLLGNDLYAEALVSADLRTKMEKLKRVEAHANAAQKLYPPNGFEQCIPTKALANTVGDLLKTKQ